jgi:hypothetical protein
VDVSYNQVDSLKNKITMALNGQFAQAQIAAHANRYAAERICESQEEGLCQERGVKNSLSMHN